MDLTARIAAALDALGASADPRQHIRERFGAPGEEILSTLDLLSRHAATLAGVSVFRFVVEPRRARRAEQAAKAARLA